MWCETSINKLIGNDMRKISFWESELGKFYKLMKKPLYCNIDMLIYKWTPNGHRCTNFNGIYNMLVSKKKSGANDFDLFRAEREKYHVKMGHVSCFLV